MGEEKNASDRELFSELFEKTELDVVREIKAGTPAPGLKWTMCVRVSTGLTRAVSMFYELKG